MVVDSKMKLVAVYKDEDDRTVRKDLVLAGVPVEGQILFAGVHEHMMMPVYLKVKHLIMFDGGDVEVWTKHLTPDEWPSL